MADTIPSSLGALVGDLKTYTSAAVQPGLRVSEIPTPALLIDLDRMERNLRTWQEIADSGEKKLRPHIKTHKVPEIGKQQEAIGACGIVAAKPTEAEVFVRSGFQDVVIAYPTVGVDKWERLARLAHAAKITVNVDSEFAAYGLSAAAEAEAVTLRVQIEVDTGLRRCGIPTEDYPSILAFAKLLMRLPGIQLEGITTHRGKFTERLAEMTNDEAGYEEGMLLVDLANRLRSDNVPIREVTAGGTITGRGVARVPGITEIRAGTYVFNDAMQVSYGSATADEVALCILTTVVSTRRTGWATIDAGSKVFSGDRSAIDPLASGSASLSPCIDVDANVKRITEEHGMVELGLGTSVAVGDKLRFTPFHACTAVNLSNELIGTRNEVVESVWSVSARGRCT